MSSVSSFKPEDDYESDSEASGALQDFSSGRRRRQTRSLSRAASVAVTSSSSDVYDSDVDSELDVTQNQNQALEARIQSLDPRALEAYSKFFADEESQFTFAKIDEEAEIFNVTQHGAVIWTATEKEKFFNHLDRKGRNGIREIAAAIGTKSELEIMDYIDFLHEGLVSHHLASLQNSTVIMGEIPAAVEISDTCRSQLDQYADALALKEDMDQLAVGRKRYGNNWIITDHQARRLFKNDDEPLRGSIHLAAGILNLPNWVQLSRRVFMNFGGKREEDNWTNIIQSAAETPSISGDALMDFYALAMSITRRLIQSSIFFAMSRLRQLQQLNQERISSTVRAEDVRAAIDVLNMKHHRGNFILDAVRRNGLVIADIRNEKGWKPQILDYDEVKQMLNGDDDDLHPGRDLSHSEPDGGSDDEENYEEESGAGRHDLPRQAEQAELKPPAAPEAESEAEDADDEEDQDEEQTHSAPPLAQESSEQPTNPAEPPSQDSDHPHPQLTRRLSNQSYLSSGEEYQASDAEEEHAERYDQEYSRIAELKMWSILQQPGPPTLSAPRLTENQIKEDAEHRPFVKRKTRREMTGWRDLTLYHSEWEEYGSDVPGLVEELAENRRKRRRVEGEEVLWETGDEEVEEVNSESDGGDQVESGGLRAEGPVPKSASVVNSEEDSDLERMDLLEG